MKLFFKSFIFFFILSGLSHSNENIRFIDVNFIVNNSNVGKSLSIIIDNKNDKIKSELKQLRKKLDIKKEKILSQKNVLKKEEFSELAKKYDDEAKDFNQIRKKKMNDFNNFQINSQKKILKLLNPLIIDYLKKQSIQILLQKDKIIFGDDNLDITEEILDIFNKKHNKIKFE